MFLLHIFFRIMTLKESPIAKNTVFYNNNKMFYILWYGCTGRPFANLKQGEHMLLYLHVPTVMSHHHVFVEFVPWIKPRPTAVVLLDYAANNPPQFWVVVIALTTGFSSWWGWCSKCKCLSLVKREYCRKTWQQVKYLSDLFSFQY